MFECKISQTHLSHPPYLAVVNWCKEQFGPEFPTLSNWLCHTGQGWSLDRQPDGDYHHLVIATFDTEEMAMAFKLRWL